MGNNIKGYNNPDEWEKLEKEAIQRQENKKNQERKDYLRKKMLEINPEEDVDAYANNDEYIEPEYVTDNISTDKTMTFVGSGDPVENLDDTDEHFLDTPEAENFDEVLQLTEYTDGALVGPSNTEFVVAEYNQVNVINIDKEQQRLAKSFVGKITKFVLEFNDVKLTEDHQKYIKQVGQLQVQNLQDLLTLVAVNKQMIANIVARVNAVQAEDYAIINAYNNLINQHIKLIKEVSNLYKSIPSVIKKMRADILSNQELESNTANEELITEDYNESQFNNSKQLLKSLLEKKKQQNTENPTQ